MTSLPKGLCAQIVARQVQVIAISKDDASGALVDGNLLEQLPASQWRERAKAIYGLRDVDRSLVAICKRNGEQAGLYRDDGGQHELGLMKLPHEFRSARTKNLAIAGKGHPTDGGHLVQPLHSIAGTKIVCGARALLCRS